MDTTQGLHHVHELRVRYSETDQMGTFYNSRALEWFECGRTELFRSVGVPYTVLEAQGVFLPVVESYVKYHGRARYDDQLQISTRGRLQGKARVRCDVAISRADDGSMVVTGYTVHAVTNGQGRPIRPPSWLVKLLGGAGAEAFAEDTDS